MIELRKETKGSQKLMYAPPARKSIIPSGAGQNDDEEEKSGDNIDEQAEELAYYEEIQRMKKDMKKAGVTTTQAVMGQEVKLKKIHTREMSRLFRSKKEIYEMMLINGQYYLPPFEECTIDFLRDIFKGKKLVSRDSE